MTFVFIVAVLAFSFLAHVHACLPDDSFQHKTVSSICDPKKPWESECKLKVAIDINPHRIILRQYKDATDLLMFGYSRCEKLCLIYQGITEIRVDAFKQMVVLRLINLNSNYISQITAIMFQDLEHLETLKLSENRLQYLTNGVFKYLGSLKVLDLSFNTIEEVNKQTFYGLKSLIHLMLGCNALKKLQHDTFSYLIFLERLTLHDNHLRDPNIKLFHNLLSLTHLDLGGNKIDMINSGLQDLINLKELLHNKNNIRLLNNNTLTALVNLVKLDLNGNKIQDIEQDAFVHTNKLKQLYLCGNEIQILQIGMFNGLISLVNLDLRDNKIITIEEGTFEPMFHTAGILKIDLRNNTMTELSWETFSVSDIKKNTKHKFNNIELFIDEHSIKCARTLCWMKYLDWENIYTSALHNNNLDDEIKIIVRENQLKTSCRSLEEICPGQAWCMYSDIQSCEAQCINSGAKGGQLIVDGDVCPFQYFCECLCPLCSEECATKGKVHVNNGINVFGCSICNCQCEKVNCYEACHGDNFQVYNNTFGCLECKCLCPNVSCEAKCESNRHNITKNNTSGCFVCNGCEHQQGQVKVQILTNVVTPSLIVLLVAVLLLALVIYIYKRKQAEPKLIINEGSSISLDILAQTLDSNSAQIIKESWIDANDLSISHLLGNGHFATVWSGSCQRATSRKFLVAIKVAKAEAEMSNQIFEDFLMEGIIMKKFKHPNILDMIGLSVYEEKPCILLPLMSHGNLKKYLQRNSTKLSNQCLTSFALGVAKGMAHLAERHFAHCDLAAKSCMLDSNLVVKICDFGLSRDINAKGCQRSDNANRPLPIRWMSIESIQTKKFTLESDVWSYGVLLWEVFSYGELPYIDIEGQKILEHLNRGQRLQKPVLCSNTMYEIMLKCWINDPKERPNFNQILKMMNKVADMAANYTEVGNESGVISEISN